MSEIKIDISDEQIQELQEAIRSAVKLIKPEIFDPVANNMASVDVHVCGSKCVA